MELNAAQLTSLEFLPAPIRSFLINRSAGIVLMLLVIILSYQLAGVTWALVGTFFQPQAQNSTKARPGTVKRTSKGSEVNYRFLSTMHLFGKESVDAVVIEAPLTAPETRLNLVLFGVFSGDDSKKGSAIIGPRTGTQKYYQVGDKVSTGVWLAEVRTHEVLLRRGSNFEVLKFPKQKSDGVKISKAKSNTLSNKPRSAMIPAGLSKGKQEFMDNVRIVPVFAGRGKGMKGYRILPKKNRQMYNRLGLRPSDIITSINGISLTDQQQSMKVIAELVKADSVEVELVRSGQTINKTLTLNP